MRIEDKVFGDSNSRWNCQRELLEAELLLAAEKLLQHTESSGMEITGAGLKVSVSLAAAERMDS